MNPNQQNIPPQAAPPTGGSDYGPYGPQPAVAQNPGPLLGTPAGPAPARAAPPPPTAVPQPPTPVVSPPPGTQPNGPQPHTAARINPNSTQNTLQIAEIRDGIVIMNDGSFRAVVMVKSINFDLMSVDEREAVEYAYQGVLNSLYFPIQIFVRSSKVDMQPYLERLDKIRQEHDNMLLSVLMEDYLGFIENLVYQTNIMDKRFYVVLQYSPQPSVQKAIATSKNFFTGLFGLFNQKEQHVLINENDLNKAKEELRNRVQALLGGLLQSGIQGLPLDTQELIELYYDSYNPDTATRQQLKNFNELSTPVVTKGEGAAPQPNLERTLKS